MDVTRFALRRPITILVGVIALVFGAALALRRMPVDIFPSLDLPVIYVAQPYGGMDPAQMEGFLTNFYEYHFLYINGIHHVESKNVQGTALMQLHFHPGTNMAQAMAETINYVNRSRAFMPPGTVSPFVMRFDTGSVPVGYLVLSSEVKSIGEIQDQALFKVRPMFASLPGVSAPPPFGGSQRTIVVSVDPDRLRSLRLAPDDVVRALGSGNAISPSGNVRLGGEYPIVPVNSTVSAIAELGSIPLRADSATPVFLRDVATVTDSTDLPVGYALADGRRAVYILVTKRADASTLDVIRNVEAALPSMRAVLPDDIRVSFAFDQSPYVTRAIAGLCIEGLLGAVLTGLMVFLFLRDVRSALIIVINIPLSILAALIGLWLAGHTINLMTLGGLALAVGILVDEATVAIENVHTHLGRGAAHARAVRDAVAETLIPRLLAMLCVLAVFLPAYFMTGAARALFAPLALAVGLSMLASYILSSTLVPVLCVWILRAVPHAGAGSVMAAAGPATAGTAAAGPAKSRFARFSALHGRLLATLVRRRGIVAAVYLVACAVAVWATGSRLGLEIFPKVDTGEFRVRIRAPDGTHFEETERIALRVLRRIEEEVGDGGIEISIGYVGGIPSSYPINAVYQWSRGPEEAILRVRLDDRSRSALEPLQEALRRELAQELPNVKLSFEPADIVSEVMSFGSPTPVEVAVSGPNLVQSRAYMERVRAELEKIPSLRDLQIAQSLDYPTLRVEVDRERAGLSGVTASEVARSLVAATSSSRFIVPNFWPDPASGIGYQVQVELPRVPLASIHDLETVPIRGGEEQAILVGDVAQVTRGSMPGQYDRYNMRRTVSMTGNISGEDLGTVSRRVAAAVRQAGEPPRGAAIEVRGQIPPMRDMLSGLGGGLILAVVVIFLLLGASFQSFLLALVAVSTAPAAIAGAAIALWASGTTINIQSFIGAVMAVGVAMANSILVVTFAERTRRRIGSGDAAALESARGRLRPVVMTSLAMAGGMVPMALGLGEGGEQTAPLGRAVIGGLAAATAGTLLALPCIFALVQGRRTVAVASLDPDDPQSPHFSPVGPSPGPEAQETPR